MTAGEAETGPFRRGIASTSPAPQVASSGTHSEALPLGPPHPAKYSDDILPLLRAWTEGCTRVLDPMAGVGKGGVASLYNELEWEWAEQCPRPVMVGNALQLPIRDNSIEAVVTSPVYGNRMSDHHDAKDNSTRITYRHKLGRPLHPANSGQLQWGSRYRDFHISAWKEVYRVLEPGGRFILNIADHVRSSAGGRQYVSTWHLFTCQHIGFQYVKGRTVKTPGMRMGQNGQARVGFEYIYYMEKPCK